MVKQSNAVKYTAILPRECLAELRGLTERKVIPSISQGIRAAVENYVNYHRQLEYQLKMREAAEDDAFIKRTMDTQVAFEFIDAESEAKW